MALTDRASEFLAERSGLLQARLASPARTSRMAVVLGRLLGAAFVICFLTGLYSHFLQEPLPWMRFPTWPTNLYQLSQGTHVTVGIAIIPLLLGKLWTVYPRLFSWPPITSAVNLIERGLIATLVACSLLEPAIGLVNTYQWYPWPFPFRETHYALAWIIVGALAFHILFKLPTIVQYWRRHGTLPDRTDPEPDQTVTHDENA